MCDFNKTIKPQVTTKSTSNERETEMKNVFMYKVITKVTPTYTHHLRTPETQGFQRITKVIT